MPNESETLRFEGDPGPRPEVSGATFAHPRYEDVRLLGQGGMGTVYQATDLDLGREVAVKWIGPEAVDDEGYERFIREASVTAQLDHPNIVPVYDGGAAAGGGLYYTMKLVRGRSLQELVDGVAASADRKPLLRAFVKVCEAVAFAHSRGVLHRDLKPENIMVGQFGEVLVMDWGLASVAGRATLARSSRVGPLAGAADLTLVGTIMGTPAFMSPEQARGEIDTLDERSDVYGLGAILYTILSGRAPYEGTVEIVLPRVQRARPLPGGRRSPLDAPDDLRAVVARSMDPDPGRRFASADELRAEVEAFLEGRPLRSGRYGPLRLAAKWIVRHRAVSAVAGVAVLLLSVTGGVAVTRILAERRVALDSAAEAVHERSLAENRALALVHLERARHELERSRVLQNGGRSHREEAALGLDAALAEVDRALAVAPDLSVAHHLRGEVQLARHEPDEAVAAWRRSMTLEPRFAADRLEAVRRTMERLLEARFLEQARGQRHADAMAAFEEIEYQLSTLLRALGDAADGPELDPIRAAILFVGSDFDGLRSFCQEALGRATDDDHRADLLAFLGASMGMGRVAEIDADRIARAFEALDEAIRIEPGHVMARIYRGWFRSSYRDDLAGTLTDYEVVLGRDRMSEAYFSAGRKWLAEGRDEEAVRALERAAEGLTPKSEVFHDLALARTRTEDLVGAVEAHRRAVEISPARHEYRRQLAEALAGLGRRDEAADEYRELLRRAPADWPHRAAVAESLRAIEGR